MTVEAALAQHLLAGLPDIPRWVETRSPLLHGDCEVLGYVEVRLLRGGADESLWDVAIETLEPYRRMGYGGSAVLYLNDLMWEKRKRPVWGALESNAASQALAGKLGFREMDDGRHAPAGLKAVVHSSATLSYPLSGPSVLSRDSGIASPVDSLKILRHDAALPVSQEQPCPLIGQ